MLEQIRQSIEQAQMVLVGIGTEFAVKRSAGRSFFTEACQDRADRSAAAALLAFHKTKRKWAAKVKKNRFRRHMKFWQIF